MTLSSSAIVTIATVLTVEIFFTAFWRSSLKSLISWTDLEHTKCNKERERERFSPECVLLTVAYTRGQSVPGLDVQPQYCWSDLGHQATRLTGDI